MTEYLVVKWLHILSSTLLFGTGIGSAYYMLRACLEARRSGAACNPAVAMVVGHVVAADTLFTATTVVFQPLSGWYLARLAGYPLDAPWLLRTYVLYAVAISCWLPVFWIQWRMHTIARQAVREAVTLPPAFWRLFVAWVALGVPALFAFLAMFYLMVAKPSA